MNEEISATQRAQKKLDKALNKNDKFGKKQAASNVEIKFRQEQLKFTREREKLKHQLEGAKNEESKGAIKDKIKEITKSFKDFKKKQMVQIKALRKG